jgi:hypothetical protein
MKSITRIILLTFAILALNPAYAVDMDDFVPADGESVTTSAIADGAVTTPKLADSAVTTTKIADEAVTAAKLGTDSVTNDKISAAAITTAELAADAVIGSRIANGTIQAQDIAASTITGNEIASDTITSSQLAGNSVGSSEITVDAVGSSEIAADAVTASEIATDAVGSAEIVADAVSSSEIVTDAVGSSEIAADAVAASEIAAGAVANSELAANAVTTDKILDGTITAADLAAGVVSTTGTKYSQVDIGSGVRTSLTIGTVGTGYGAAPVLRYDNSNTSYSRWTLAVPDDYIAGTNIVVELMWSPSNTSAGNVVWEVDYASLAAGEVVPGSASFTAKTFTQAASGTTLALASTGNNITINAADIAADEVINLVVLRDPDAVADTYANDANIHLVKIKYQAKKVS